MFDPTTFPFWRPGWGWHYEPNAVAGPAYRRHGATARSRGSLGVYIPGATDEQLCMIEDGLIRRFDPASIVPGTRFIPRDMGHRAGGHNSELAPTFNPRRA